MYIAHVRKSDKAKQSVEIHLQGTAELAKGYAEKLGLPLSGELIGLVHDLGKYSEQFQEYITRVTGVDGDNKKINYDEDEEMPKRGSVDHSTAGGQYLYNQFLVTGSKFKNGQYESECQLLAEILLICVVSHHSGLINIYDQDKTDILDRRYNKAEEKTHYQEATVQAKKKDLFNTLPPKWQIQTLKEFVIFFRPLFIQL